MDDASRAVGYYHKESDGHKGRVSKLWKVTKENGVEISRELVSSDTYRMANDIYIRGTRQDAPPPPPAETPEAPPEDNSGATQDPPADNTQAPDMSLGPAFDPKLQPAE